MSARRNRRLVAAASTGPPATEPAADHSSRVAIRIIRDEHLAIASVLYALRRTAARIGRRPGLPNLRLLRAIVDYIETFPEQLHHPKESEHLFAALAARSRTARPLIAELEAEHARGAVLVAELRRSLAGLAAGGEAHRESFVRAVDDYAAFHWQHMSREEELLIPLALRHLGDDDWTRVADAFRDNDRPRAGPNRRDRAERLYRRILDAQRAESRTMTRADR